MNPLRFPTQAEPNFLSWLVEQILDMKDKSARVLSPIFISYKLLKDQTAAEK
jgi:hypothetical protein